MPFRIDDPYQYTPFVAMIDEELNQLKCSTPEIAMLSQLLVENNREAIISLVTGKLSVYLAAEEHCPAQYFVEGSAARLRELVIERIIVWARDPKQITCSTQSVPVEKNTCPPVLFAAKKTNRQDYIECKQAAFALYEKLRPLREGKRPINFMPMMQLEFSRILHECLKFSKKNAFDIQVDNIQELRDNCYKVCFFLQVDKIMFEDFVAYDDETKFYILGNLEKIQELAVLANQSQLQTYLSLGLQAREQNEDQELRNSYLKKQAIIEVLVIRNDGPENIFELGHTVEFLYRLASEHASKLSALQYDLCLPAERSGSGQKPFTLNDLLKLSGENIEHLLRQARDLRSCCRNTNLRIAELMSLTGEKTAIWIKHLYGAARIEVLINYYSMRLEDLAACDDNDFAKLLDCPILAIEGFNLQAKSFTLSELTDCLGGVIKTMQSHCDKFKQQGYFINLTKMQQHAAQTLAIFKKLGANFDQALAISNVLLQVNYGFLFDIVDVDCRQKLQEVIPRYVFVKQFFTAEQAALIKSLIDQYIEFLFTQLADRNSNQFGVPKDLDLNNFEPENLEIDQIKDGELHLQHLNLLKNLSKNEFAKRGHKYSRYIKDFRHKFEDIYSLPSCLITEYGSIGENELFGAIDDYKIEEVKKLVDTLEEFSTINSRCYGYLACASHSENKEIYLIIQNFIKRKSETLVQSFLQTNAFKVAAGQNALALAIEQENYPVFLGLLVREYNLSSCISQQAVLALAARSKTFYGRVMVKDIHMRTKVEPDFLHLEPEAPALDSSQAKLQR